MKAEEYWERSGMSGEYQAWAFTDAPDRLADLVKKGIKKATASAYAAYEAAGEKVPEEGDCSIILDSRGDAVCIIRTTSVSITPFCEVTEEFAAKEGEGDLSLSCWREIHEDFMRRELEKTGRVFDENALVVCEEFEVITSDSIQKKIRKGRDMKEKWQWIREPEKYLIEENRIEITTEPHTDLWQRTYYHFRNDNAPALQMETEEKYFSFIVRTDFSDSHHRFDQCGIVMYLDAENWLKASVEYENESFQHLGSVVTNHGYSDWATVAIPADVKVMWYRFSRREDDYCVENSVDGIHFSQMRICHMHEGAEKIRFGIYACSPEDSSFKAVFTEMKLTECAWKAHDGQQPDE